MGIIFRQSLKGTIIHSFGLVIGMITTLFIQAAYLTKAEVGLMKVIYDSAVLMCSLALLGTTSSAIRFFPFFKNSENKDNGFFFYLLILPAIGVLIFIPLVFLLKNVIIDFFIERSALYTEYFNWVIPLVLFLMYWTLFETYSNIKMRIVVPKLIREVGVRILLLVMYVAYGFKLLTLTQLVTCSISIYAIALITTFIYIRKFNGITLKHDYKFIDKELKRKILKYTAFLILTALSTNILVYLDSFMISSMKGLDFTGIYVIAGYMASMIEMPTRSITTISSPIAADALKNNDFKKANDLYKTVSIHQLVASSVIFLFIWINIDNIFAIMPNGNTYVAGKWVVLFLGLGKIITSMLNFGGVLISYSRYYYWSLFFSIFILSAGICTNLLLIPKFGITGASLATLTTCLLSCSVQQWIVLKKVKGNPYTINTFKQITLIIVLIGINYLLPNWTANPFFDATYRSIIIGTLTIFCLYKLKISDSINRVIEKSCVEIKNRIKI